MDANIMQFTDGRDSVSLSHDWLVRTYFTIFFILLKGHAHGVLNGHAHVFCYFEECNSPFPAYILKKVHVSQLI